MIIVCPGCKARLKLPDEKMKPGGVRLKCARCGNVFAHRTTPAGKPAGAGTARTVQTPGRAAGKTPSARPAQAPLQKRESTNKAGAAAPAQQTRKDTPSGAGGHGDDAGLETGPSAEDIAKAEEAYRRYGFMAEGPERMKQRPFTEMLPGAFSFPLKGGGPLMLGIGAVFITVTLFFSRFAFLVGILGYIFVGGFLASFMMRIVSQSADGGIDFPDWPDFSDWWDDILGPVFQITAVTLVSYLPLILYIVLARPGGLSFPVVALVCLGALYQPMALIAMSLFRSAGALNPVHIVPAILKVPADYAVTIGGLLLIFGVKAAARWISIVPFAGTLLGNLFMLYLLTVEMRMLGLLYYSNRDRFNWF